MVRSTKELLQHEILHLKIAEYITQKAKANLPKLIVGKGQDSNADKDTAIDNAVKKAKNDIKKYFEAFKKKWEEIDTAASPKYDRQTNHGLNAAIQADWNSKYQKFVDAILKEKEW